MVISSEVNKLEFVYGQPLYNIHLHCVLRKSEFLHGELRAPINKVFGICIARQCTIPITS